MRSRVELGQLMFILFYIFPKITYGERERIKIGGIFDAKFDEPEIAFKYAVEAINNEIITKDFILKEQSHRIDYGNEFLASQKLCRLLEAGSGVAAIFGPQAPTSALHVQSVCDAKEMAHIETRWSTEANKGPTINIHPHPEALAKVFIDLVRDWEWKTFTILYESGPFLPFVSDLLKYYDRNGYTVSVEQLDLTVNLLNYRSVLQRVKNTEERNIVLHCSIDILPEVLKQSQQVGIMTEYHQFFITSMDMHTIDMEPYQYSGTNITGIRLIDPEDPYVKHVTDFFNSSEHSNSKMTSEGLTADKMLVETALMFDGVLLFGEALKSFGIELKNKFESEPSKFETMSLKCKDQTTWRHGLSLYNYMKMSTVHGLTRTIKFDEYGHRSDFLLDIIELTHEGIKKVGTWDRVERLKMSREAEISNSAVDDGTLRNKTFIVITVINNPPYGMLKETAEKLSGNDRFEGFGIDLIHELSLMLGFNYTFRIQEDRAYGSLNPVTQQWNGMIRELHEYRADLAITDLTITAERESAADFTMPFMNLGISILFRKPTKEPPSTFSFMAPFSKEVWAYLGGAYLIVSFSLFILGRLSPKEWDNPYPCVDEPEFLQTQFSLSNAMWFTIGALLQQGSEIAPKAASTRAVASIWWFFTLIMVSSYTANLAAFLTVEPTLTLIESAEQLEKLGGKIQYGAKKDGSTLNFFKNAEYETYKRMFLYMNSTDNVLTSSNEEGLEKVKKEHYAYLMESTSIEYYAERECNTTQVGGLLDEKGYGIAMRKNSPYRNALSEAVLRLQEQGKLTKLKTKWWKEKKGGGACSSATSEGGAAELGLANVGGVFYVVLMGCIIGFLYGITEWFFSILTRAHENKVPFKEEFVEEFKFVVKCHGNTKTVRHRKSSSNDSRNSNISQRSLRSQSAESKADDKSRKVKRGDLNI